MSSLETQKFQRRRVRLTRRIESMVQKTGKYITPMQRVRLAEAYARVPVYVPDAVLKYAIEAHTV